MAFIRKIDLLRHQQGSLEARLQVAKQAVRQALGEDATVLATHDTYALARSADGQVQTVQYQLQEGQASGVTVVASDVPVLTGMALDRAVADDLPGVVTAMLEGQAMDRTRMRDLARMARTGAAYWMADALAMTESVGQGAAWWAYFAPQALQVRERLHGTIKQIEAPVPTTRFARLADARLGEYAQELRECVGTLRAVARGVFDTLKADVSYHDETVKAVHESLRQEMDGLNHALAWVEQMEWTGKLPDVAIAHDRIAARLRDGLVVRAHLRSMTKDEGNE